MVIDGFWPALNSAMGNTSSSGVQKCLEGALGKDVAFKSDPLFQLSHVKPYNLGISSVPAAVTYPKTSEQIGKIVKCAVDNSLKVQPRCGGHSYANYGTFVESDILESWQYFPSRVDQDRVHNVLARTSIEALSRQLVNVNQRRH
jgi:hypothetical protein